MTGYYGYELNWLGITLAALMPLVVGAIWYHPRTFGKVWMDSLGFTEEDLKKGNMAVTFGVTFIMSFTLAYYFAMRYHAHGDNGIMAHAAYHGFMTFGYLGMPILIMHQLFERRSWSSILVNVGYWFLAVMALVLVVHLMPGAEIPEVPE